ncbi:MAG: aminoacyl-histidine dipeptidase [Clostridiales bacterium]|nr:aminoacyl-histidine dipeptidase [Clostridiales bacterium]
MSKIRELEPKNVFSYFDDICSIPHGSGNTAAISDYLVKFAVDHSLRYRKETCGNVIIKKAATPGYEHADTVMLQGHMDMVTVKNEGCGLDLEHDHILPAITEDGEWIYARGTSLGGDDGIALAFCLAILDDNTLPHPALEAVFTVDEEIGLLGASALDASDLTSSILLNMDSEEDGCFLTSCAGGATVKCIFPVVRESRTGSVFEFEISGLTGGHSGGDAHLEQANANLLLGRFLAEISDAVDFGIVDICGGEVDNAIPVEAAVRLIIKEKDTAALEGAVSRFCSDIRREYATKEPDMTFSLTPLSGGAVMAVVKESAKPLIAALELLPAGIQRRMPDIPDMIQTSLNLGVIAMSENKVKLTYSVRSSSATEKAWLIKRMGDLTEILGGHAAVEGSYPAWEYIPGSRIQKIMSETYEKLSGKRPTLTGIHAGVECGILSVKLPGLDCISYGPQMSDIHTTRERLNIKSVKQTYELTLKVLEKLR